MNIIRFLISISSVTCTLGYLYSQTARTRTVQGIQSLHAVVGESDTQVFMPYAEEWNMTPADIETAAQLFVQDYGIMCKRSAPSKMLLFLYAKGMLASKSSAARKLEFEELLGAQTTDLGKALERLEIIVEKGETIPTKLNLAHMFDIFVAKHPEWAEKVSFVLFRDHEDLKGKAHALVERIQNSGLCYMHACVVVQHYLVAMNSESKIPMLDMAEYLKKYMPVDSLFEHIWKDRGGDSLDFLKSILEKKPRYDGIVSRHPTEGLCNDDLDTLLKLYGPGLVSGFAVRKDFMNDDWQHLGENKVEEFQGRHAMVLVGYRLVDGKRRYLLQNWWKTKPYVEVDIEYLLSSDATVHFIKEKQFRMGDYPTRMDELVECESGIDASENFIPDGFFASLFV